MEHVGITGVEVVEATISDAYLTLRSGGSPCLSEDGKLLVYKFVDAELDGLKPFFAVLPDGYMWVSALLHSAPLTSFPDPAAIKEKIAGGGYSDAVKKIYRRSGVTKGNAIRGVLYPSLDPFYQSAKKGFPLGADVNALFLDDEQFASFASELNEKICQLREFLVYPLNAGPDREEINWQFVLQESWARAREVMAREYALKAANAEIEKALALSANNSDRLYFGLDPLILFSATPLAISWGGSDVSADENELLWERVDLQGTLIDSLGWPIFYPYVVQHIDAKGDWFQNLERWASSAPPRHVDCDEVINRMRHYLAKCENRFPLLKRG